MTTTTQNVVETTGQKVRRGDYLLTDQGYKLIAILDWNADGVWVTFDNGWATVLTYGQTVTVIR